MNEVREIGSEFWDVPLSDNSSNLFSSSVQWFVSGRSALQSIIMELGRFHSIAMPSWCCESMVKPFVEAGMQVSFYPVLFDGSLIQEIFFDCDVLFLMDYFGYTGVQPDLSGFKGVVIRDVTHSLFSKTYSDADFFFGSLRKWCGVWTGGFAWTKDGHKLAELFGDENDYFFLRETAMRKKAEFIRGVSNDKDYLEFFKSAEEALDNIGVCPAAKRDIDFALSLNVDDLKRIRRGNAEILMEAFPNWLIFPEMKNSDCPMFVPIIIPNGKRNALRCFLIDNEIYCPVHWPISDYHKFDERARYIYDNELSLICDQRYNEKDMRRIVETIRLFWKGVC